MLDGWHGDEYHSLSSWTVRAQREVPASAWELRSHPPHVGGGLQDSEPEAPPEPRQLGCSLLSPGAAIFFWDRKRPLGSQREVHRDKSAQL